MVGLAQGDGGRGYESTIDLQGLRAFRAIEEPLRADRPLEEWKALARVSPVDLAAGENIIGERAFDDVIESRSVTFVQPDLCKWGGISKCLPLARRIAGALNEICDGHVYLGELTKPQFMSR